MLEPPPIDWTKPVQWNTGEECRVDPVHDLDDRFILIGLGKRYPSSIYNLAQRKSDQREAVVVHADTGVPVTTLAEYAPDAWIENVEKEVSPWEEIAGTF